ncbi:MAG TPA: hypothetical protein VIZ28_04160 [Chitinophagaceae bacterium]
MKAQRNEKKLTLISATNTIMDINHIQLPATTIADLYRSSLIETGEIPAMVEPAAIVTSGKQKYLGENQKNILIVVYYSDAVYLPDDELSFLTNMLTACQLSLADVAILNRNNNKETDYKDLIPKLKSRIVFLFGVDPASFGLPVSFPHFQVQPFANATFLFAPSLIDCKNDSLLKSKLWLCLRRIFAI